MLILPEHHQPAELYIVIAFALFVIAVPVGISTLSVKWRSNSYMGQYVVFRSFHSVDLRETINNLNSIFSGEEYCEKSSYQFP